MEAEEPAADGKVREEVDERGDIVVGRGAQAERRAVTEDDVDSDVGMVHLVRSFGRTIADRWLSRIRAGAEP